MSSRLAIAVSFFGKNQLSGPIKNIVRDSKDAKKSIKGMAAEVARLEKELDGVNRELRETTGIHPTLLNRQAALRRQLTQTTDALADQRRQLERIETIQSRAGKVGTTAMGAGAAVTATVTIPVVAGAQASIQHAMDAQELNSAFAVTFGKNAAAMNEWAESTGDSMGRSTQEMQRFANQFGLLFKQAAPEKAADMSKNFAVLAQDIASFNNVSNETAMQSLMSGLSGEAEPMRKFGVFLNEGAVKAKALALGLGAVGRELTDEEKIQARYALILEKTKDAQGDVVRTSDSATNKLKAMKGQFEEQAVAIGTKLLPIIPPLADAVMTVLTAFNNLSPETQKWIIYATLAGAALGPLLMGLGGAAFAIRNIAGTIGGAITMFQRLRAANIATSTTFGLVKNGFALLKTGALSFGRAMLLMGRALLMNPIGLLVTAIGIAAYLIYTHWDKIKGAFRAGIGYLGQAWAWLKSNARNILQFSGPIGQAALFIWDNWATIKSAFSQGLAFVSGLVGRFVSIGRAIIDGLVSGITAAPGRVWAALKSIVMRGVDGVKNLLWINSPSRVFMGFGGSISEGLAMGIDRGGRQPLGSMKRLAAGVAAAGAMSLSPAYASGARGGGPGAGPASGGDTWHVTIKVEARDGQSAKEIADEVIRHIEKLKEVKSRSAFDDDE